MHRNVCNYEQRCQKCQKVIASHRKAAGLLQPLPILDGPFQDISQDFVGSLPISHPNKDTLCFTIMDWFSKSVMLIPCKPIVATEEVARFFTRFWYPIARLSKTVTSYRDTKFASLFSKALFASFGTHLQFSSTFHLETNGHTKIYIQWAFDVMKAYCDDQLTNGKFTCHWYKRS